MKEMWDVRYAEEGYAYGKEPNKFLELQLAKIPTNGKALFAAEGEGRNAVHAAKLGWEATAFDLSESGKTKALLLAEQENTVINYHVENLQNLDFKPNEFDLLVLIYAHFPAALKSEFHKKLAKYVKPGGYVIFEAFSKKHIEYNSVNPKAGGPKDVSMLFSTEEVRLDFTDFAIIELQEKDVELNEGKYHKGLSSVVQFVGRK